MASSYTTNKGLEQPANGDYVGNWNLPVNADWSTLDTCFGGVQVLTPTGLSGTVTLTSTTSGTQPYTRTTQWQSPNIVIGISATGQATLTNNINYQLPSGIGGTWTIWNNTTGAYTVTFSSAGGGSSVVLPQGHRIQVVSDGTNIQVAQDSALNFTLNGFLRLYGATSGYVGFQASASNTSVTWTLPPGDGTSGQVMITNGAGVLSWYTLPVVSGYLPLTGGTLTGSLVGTSATFSSNVIAPLMTASNVAGTYRHYQFQTSLSPRWDTGADASAESGSNAGSNFYISRFTDTGAAIDTPLGINRATGVVTIQDGLVISTGGCTVTGGFLANSGLQSVVSGSTTNGAVSFGTYGNEVLDSNTASTLTINRAGYTYVASQGAWAHNGAFTNKGLVNNTGPIITGTYTLTTALSNSFVELAGSGAYTVTLPAPSTIGIEYRIWLNNASTITLSTPSGLIGGYGNAASSVGLSQSVSTFYYLASDGFNWWLQAIAGYNSSNILSAGLGLSIYNTGGIFNTSNSGDLYFSGGTSYNQGAAITLNGPSNGGSAQIYTGTGGTNALSMNFGPSGDAYFGGSFGPTSTVSVGYRGIPQSGGGYKGSNYTAVLSDAGSSIVTSTTGLTFTIPANASVAYPIGTTLTFVYGNGTGSLSIAINSDTLYLANTGGTTGTRTLSPWGIATAIKVTSTIWIISGAGLA